ncbi:MAG TPA: DUF1877 family protein [Candidatus Glassbacteria bacterium]|nr:DUF1877 family protein [Candidatus Glassbacteria bacterium]
MGIHVYFIRVTRKIFSELINDCDKLVEFIDQQLEVDEEINYNWTEKAWEGLFFLIYDIKYFDTNTKKLAGTMLNGMPLYCKEYDWLTAEIQDPKHVKQIYNRLRSFTKDSLAKKYDAKLFSKLEIYPSRNNWDERDIEYLLSHWDGLLEIYRNAAEKNEYILVYWSI